MSLTHFQRKVLALVGRAEVRDWVDLIHCHDHLQPFGYLVWATCGKDPGLSPEFIVEQAARSAHYSKVELDTLAYDGQQPDIANLSQTWRRMLQEAREIIQYLPEEKVGSCILDTTGTLFNESAMNLQNAIQRNSVHYHQGTICGAWPTIISPLR